MKFAAKVFASLFFTFALTLPQAITPLTATAHAQTNPAASTDEKARMQLRAAVKSESEAELQRVETAFPRTEEAIAALRKIYFDAPQAAEAGLVSERLTALGSSTAPTDAAQQRARADKLYQANLYVLAAQAYDQLARQFPTSASDEVSLRAGV